jgi:hypothetical protein
MAGITHAFVSGIADGADTTLVRPVDWNATHIGLTIVRKTADETVNNSKVLQNDDHLLLAIAANEVWLVELVLLIQSVSAGSDFKCGWAYPAGCSIYWGAVAAHKDATEVSDWTTAQDTYVSYAANALLTAASTRSSPGMAGIYGIILKAIVINGATAGNLNFQWAQVTATAEDTKVLANSCLIAHKLA